MRVRIHLLALTISVSVSAGENELSRNCLDTVANIQFGIESSQEFFQSPDQAAAEHLLSVLNQDHKVLHLCGTKNFQDSPEMNQIVADIATNEFFLARAVENWLDPEFKLGQERFHAEAAKRHRLLNESIEKFNKHRLLGRAYSAPQL